MTASTRLEAPRATDGARPAPRPRRHILDLDDYTRSEIEDVLDSAEAMSEVLDRDIKKVPTLRGKSVLTLFVEASTRTRVSFEQAGKILSADVINLSGGGTSMEKGESLYNTALTLQAMRADVIIIRHPHAGAPYLLARHLDASIVNAGDGAHAHPTQALLDLYTIRRRFGRIEGLKVVIVGDITYSRVARSNLWGLTKMGAEVVVCAPPTLLPVDFAARHLRREGHPFASVGVSTDVERALDGADVVMTLRLQQERQQAGHLPSLREYSQRYGINARRLESGQAGRAGDAPRADERGRGDRPGGGARGEVADRGAGHERGGSAHGGADGPCRAAPPIGGARMTNETGGTAPLLIKGGRVIDPSQGMDTIADVLLRDGVVAAVGADLPAVEGVAVMDAAGLVVCPGFVDVHCHLREPGFEYKETIATGTRAAARGGFTTVCAMPNTQPALDSRAAVEFVLEQAAREGAVRVLPIGCVTAGGIGGELAEMAELADAGVIGFSDDGMPVSDSNLMRQALSYSAALGLPVINHCEVHELSEGGSINEGWVSNRLGVKGVPGAAEDVMVARDIELAELTGGRLHVAHVSTVRSLEHVARAKDRGLDVTCEVTPHHLTLTDEAVMGLAGDGSRFAPLTRLAYDPNAKVNPPLRGPGDMAALVAGLKDGTIDFIATDHAPHNAIDKMTTVDEAAFGISVLETAFGSLMSLVHSGEVTLPLLIDKLTQAPARFLGRELGTLRPGAPADVVALDAGAEWVVDTAAFASKGKNTPLEGATLRGRVAATVYGGAVVYDGVQAG